MSESAFETPEMFRKPVSPQVLIGVASPLWLMFAGAAMSGAAWWWMTRWARPANLEALFGAALPKAAQAPQRLAEAIETEIAEDVAEIEALVDQDLPMTVVGGEGAPFSVVLETVVEAVPAPVPVAVEAAPAAPEVVAESAPVSEPKPAAEPATVVAKTPAAPKPVAEPRSVAPKAKAAPSESKPAS